ncbi:MAG: zinc ribbon domain-containing protein [Terrimesophilobacter sp.]
MPSVDNLLIMDRCESCERELASEWKFCIYCGRPVGQETEQEDSQKADHKRVPIPAAIRPDIDVPPRRKYDSPFWVGVGMGVLGLALIIYAAVQIYGSYA